jgi:hypothetical protein
MGPALGVTWGTEECDLVTPNVQGKFSLYRRPDTADTADCRRLPLGTSAWHLPAIVGMRHTDRSYVRALSLLPMMRTVYSPPLRLATRPKGTDWLIDLVAHCSHDGCLL